MNKENLILDQIKDLNRVINDMRKEVRIDMSSLKDRLETVERNMGALESGQRLIIGRIESMEYHMAELNAGITTHSQTIKNHENRITALETV